MLDPMLVLLCYTLIVRLVVSPEKEMLDPGLKVRPDEEKRVSPKPCSLNHYPFSQLFKEVTEQVKRDYQQIYQKYPDTARKCFDCHNRERNYQIMLKLLNSYERSLKRSL